MSYGHEVAGALQVLAQPFVDFHNQFILKPCLQVISFWIDFISRYGLDSEMGHVFVRGVMNPFLTYTTSQLYHHREFMRRFQDITIPAKIVLSGMFTFLNRPILTVPMKQMITNGALVYCDVMYGQRCREDLNMFFFIGVSNNGQMVGREYAAGDPRDTSNCFFPLALCHGVRKQQVQLDLSKHQDDKPLLMGHAMGAPPLRAESNSSVSTNADNQIPDNEFKAQDDLYEAAPELKLDDEEHDEAIKELKRLFQFVDVRSLAKDELAKYAETDVERRQLRVAMSCCLFSALTYRTDDELKLAQKAGMLPDVEIYSVETGESGTGLIAFVSKQYKWVVFSYRGTQFEVFRQMLTSIDFSTQYFECNDTIPGPMRPVDSNADCHGDNECGLRADNTQPKVRSVYMTEIKRSSELFPFRQLFEGKRMTPMQLARHLASQNFRLYVTGHSLGGGLAQLFAARLMVMKVPFEAVITFGATPAGNQAFANWFNQTAPCSWRFVYGDEFAPMVPPIPFTAPTDEFELVHVNNLVHFEKPVMPRPDTHIEMEALLTKYATETGLINTLIDHNLFNVMRRFKEYNMDDENVLELKVNEKSKLLVQNMHKDTHVLRLMPSKKFETVKF